VDKMPFEFTGVLNKVVIELGKSGLAANDDTSLEEANTKLAESAYRDCSLRRGAAVGEPRIGFGAGRVSACR